MKAISRRAKADYLAGYVGRQYTRRLKLIDKDDRIVGPYKLKFDDLHEGVDYVCPGNDIGAISGCDTVELREIDNLFGDELQIFAKIITGRDFISIDRRTEYDDIKGFELTVRVFSTGDVRAFPNSGRNLPFLSISTIKLKHGFDYLRRIGVALPYYDADTNVEYSVADLVENNTIKIVN